MWSPLFAKSSHFWEQSGLEQLRELQSQDFAPSTVPTTSTSSITSTTWMSSSEGFSTLASLNIFSIFSLNYRKIYFQIFLSRPVNKIKCIIQKPTAFYNRLTFAIILINNNALSYLSFSYLCSFLKAWLPIANER